MLRTLVRSCSTLHRCYAVSHTTDTGCVLASAVAIKAMADLLRPIPPANFDAQEPSKAYIVCMLVSETILQALNIVPLLPCTEKSELQKLHSSPGPVASVHHSWAAIQRAQHGSVFAGPAPATAGADGILKINSGSK